MEPSTKKRKLAPKVNAPAPNPQPTHYPHDLVCRMRFSYSFGWFSFPIPFHQAPCALSTCLCCFLQPDLLTRQTAQQGQPQPQPPPQHYAVQEAPPAAFSERHDFESFARHLQDAAMLIQRQTERPSYADVSVLLLKWDEDKSADDDLAALEDVFQKQFKYQTQRWNIPTVANPTIKLGVQMASFLEHARPNHLLIIYYIGHGFVGADGQLYWAW